MTQAEQIATALKDGDTTCNVGGCFIAVSESVHQLYLGAEIVGGYYPELKRAMFFKVSSPTKTQVINLIKRYI